MGERTEKFCDLSEPKVEEGRKSAQPLLDNAGHCLEPAVGTCKKCGRDYCQYHKGRVSLELDFGYDFHRDWPISICKDCKERMKGAVLSRKLVASFSQLQNDIEAWLPRSTRAKKKKRKKAD